LVNTRFFSSSVQFCLGFVEKLNCQESKNFLRVD
jgi:hypothetical protein